MGNGPGRQQRQRRRGCRPQAERPRRRRRRWPRSRSRCVSRRPQPDGGVGQADRQGRERGGAADEEAPELLDGRGGAAGCRGARGGRRGPAGQHLRVPRGVPHQVRACVRACADGGVSVLSCSARSNVLSTTSGFRCQPAFQCSMFFSDRSHGKCQEKKTGHKESPPLPPPPIMTYMQERDDVVCFAWILKRKLDWIGSITRRGPAPSLSPPALYLATRRVPCVAQRREGAPEQGGERSRREVSGGAGAAARAGGERQEARRGSLNESSDDKRRSTYACRLPVGLDRQSTTCWVGRVLGGDAYVREGLQYRSCTDCSYTPVRRRVGRVTKT